MEINNKYSKYAVIICIFIILISSLFLKIQKKVPTVCLCAVGRQENRYAKEFVEHYKNLGYNHVFIYDNNNLDEEKFSDVLQEEINEGYVTIIDFRGKRDNRSQSDAYSDCYQKNKYKYNWLSFFDFDEFLELHEKNTTIQDYLSKDIFKKCQNIKINWIIYVSEKELLYYENKPLKIRFTKPIYNDYYFNIHTKSTVIGGQRRNYWSRLDNPHCSLHTFRACSASGRKVSYKNPCIDPPDYRYAELRHYHFKSFEEYCLKLKRGFPDATSSLPRIQNLIKQNSGNKEKIKILEKVFNISITPA